MKNITLPPAEFSITQSTERINFLHSQIHVCGRKMLEYAAEIGNHLGTIKATLDHGDWLPWLEKNVTFTDRAASNYMRIAAHQHELSEAKGMNEALKLLSDQSKSETVSDLKSKTPMKSTKQHGESSEKPLSDSPKPEPKMPAIACDGTRTKIEPNLDTVALLQKKIHTLETALAAATKAEPKPARPSNLDDILFFINDWRTKHASGFGDGADRALIELKKAIKAKFP